MRRYLIALAFLCSTGAFAQDAYFNFSLGPDIQVKQVESGYTDTRLRLEFELGEKNFGFVFQPSFGNDVFALFLGPRLMLPLQIGSSPLFIIPDVTVGPDFGFAHDTVGLALDFKLGFRAFYEFAKGFAVSFRPFGVTLRPFNTWFGTYPNQTKLSVTYEMQFGIAYFF